MNLGITKMIKRPTMPTMTATAIPVASDHSNPLPAILVTAQTAMMGAFRIIIKPIVISI